MKEYPIKYMTNYTAVTVGFKAFADGFEPSDMVESDYTATGPIINIVDYHVLNIIADICVSHDYNIYIDDVYVATVAYTPGSIAQYELATYVDNTEMHKVHIISVGTGLLQNRSNDAYMYCPIYGVTGLTSVNTALQRTGDAINLTWAFDANGMLNSDFDDVFPWNEAVFETHDQYRQFIRLPDMYFTIETTSAGILSAVSVSKQPSSYDENTYFVKSFCVGRYEGEYNTF